MFQKISDWVLVALFHPPEQLATLKAHMAITSHYIALWLMIVLFLGVAATLFCYLRPKGWVSAVIKQTSSLANGVKGILFNNHKPERIPRNEGDRRRRVEADNGNTETAARPAPQVEDLREPDPREFINSTMSGAVRRHNIQGGFQLSLREEGDRILVVPKDNSKKVPVEIRFSRTTATVDLFIHGKLIKSLPVSNYQPVLDGAVDKIKNAIAADVL